jgi:cadmium resistance protein CadD (predicted permease)
MRGNKRFLSGKQIQQIQQFSTVLDTCIVLIIFFSHLYVNKTKQQAVPIQLSHFLHVQDI